MRRTAADAGATRRAVLAGAGALAACGPGGGSAAPAIGAVAAIPDARSLILDTGLEVRLAGLESPRPAQGGAAAEPLFEAARAELVALAMDERVSLSFAPGVDRRDRFGRAVARADVDGVWLQRRLVEAGLGRVAPEAASAAWDAELLVAEVDARLLQRGLWSRPYYAVRAPEAAGPAAGTFQIVEGEVVDATARGAWTYLNFGPDWRTDFTAAVPPERQPAFEKVDLIGLSGVAVRVRGFVDVYNGPFIRLRTPGQLEVLSG